MESTYSNKDNGGAYDINYIPELTEIKIGNAAFYGKETLELEMISTNIDNKIND